MRVEISVAVQSGEFYHYEKLAEEELSLIGKPDVLVLAGLERAVANMVQTAIYTAMGKMPEENADGSEEPG